MYSAKLTGLKPKDVMNLINSMPAHVDIKFAQTQTEAPAKPNGKAERIEPNDFVMLGTPFKRREGTMPDIMCRAIEAFEKKHGQPGCMTRAVLTKRMEKFSDAPGAVITAGLAKGIIKGVKAS